LNLRPRLWSRLFPGDPAKRGAGCACGSLVGVGERVAVDAEDEDRIGVPERVGDDTRRKPSVQQQRRVRMP